MHLTLRLTYSIMFGTISLLSLQHSHLLSMPNKSCTSRQNFIMLNNGVQMPVVAFGTGDVRQMHHQASTTAAVLAAIKAGYCHVDTAHSYFNQGAVSAALTGRNRQELFLTTKVPGCGLWGASISHCKADTETFIRDSLIQLEQEHVDLLLLHSPPFQFLSSCTSRVACATVQMQWAELERAYYSNLTRAIGLSNFVCPKCMECVMRGAKVRPMVNQISIHLGMGEDPYKLRRLYPDVVVQAYSPLAGAAGFSANPSQDLFSLQSLQEAARYYGKSPAQVALRWLVDNGMAFVSSSHSADHLRETFDIFRFKIDAAHMLRLNEVHFPAASCNAEPSRWISLFNGNDLHNWTQKIFPFEPNQDPYDTFRVKNKTLQIRYDSYPNGFDNHIGHLFYNQVFSSFRLHIEYRFVAPRASNVNRYIRNWTAQNSGVEFHAQPPTSMLKFQPYPECIEVQLLGDLHANPTLNVCPNQGTRFDLADAFVEQPFVMFQCTASTSKTYALGQWVSATIDVHGAKHVRHLDEDGRTVLEYKNLQRVDGSPLSYGYIALQSESQPMDFRKIELLPLAS